MEIEKIKNLDKKAHQLKTQLLYKKYELDALRNKYYEYIQKEKEILKEIEEIEAKIDEIKQQIDMLYGDIQEPIFGSLHYFRFIPDIKVIDLDKIPNQYKKLDTTLVRESFKNGIKIPGIIVDKKRIICLK